MSHIVSGLTWVCSTHMPAPPMKPENTSACSGVSSPCGSGRMRVRAMRASMCCSISELTAKAAPASSQMPSVAIATVRADGIPGVARNMPMTAQKIASCVTRGLVSAQYWDAKWPSERWVEMIWPRIELVGCACRVANLSAR